MASLESIRMPDDLWTRAEDGLLTQLQLARRGHKRNGSFALWLFLRVCEGVRPPFALSERTHRARVRSLERRLSSLSLPASLRRPLAGSIRSLEEGTAGAASAALRQLVVPARDALGPEVAEAVAAAAQATAAAADKGGEDSL